MRHMSKWVVVQVLPGLLGSGSCGISAVEFADLAFVGDQVALILSSEIGGEDWPRRVEPLPG